MPGSARETPLVSVVIPAFNRAPVLERSVGSALAQTFSDLEVLVVDDASTDATRAKVAAISTLDPRVRLLALTENGGAAHARNAGVAAARGQFVAFLDSDDWWLPPKLAAQIAALQTAARPERTLCAHAHHVDDHLAPRTWPKRGPRPGEPLSEYLFVANGNFHTSTWLLSRALAGEFAFDSSLRRHQDWDLLLRFAEAGVEFCYLSDALSHRVCAGPDRLSDIADADYSRTFAETRHRLFSPAARAAFGARILSWQLFRRGKKREALGLLAHAWRVRALPAADILKIALRLTLPAVHARLVKMKS